jgi:hypothetical protein
MNFESSFIILIYCFYLSSIVLNLQMKCHPCVINNGSFLGESSTFCAAQLSISVQLQELENKKMKGWRAKETGASADERQFRLHAARAF